jgi:hypothetical protein
MWLAKSSACCWKIANALVEELICNGKPASVPQFLDTGISVGENSPMRSATVCLV